MRAASHVMVSFSNLFFLRKHIQDRHEILRVAELMVHAGETDECDLIELEKLPHKEFSEILGLDLGVDAVLDLVLNGSQDLFDLLVTDRPFSARDLQPAFQFVAVENFTGPIPFDDFDGRTFHSLIGRETFLAVLAFPAPADPESIIAGSGIDHPVIILTAVGTFHFRFSPNRSIDCVLVFFSACLGTFGPRLRTEDPSFRGGLSSVGNVEKMRHIFPCL